MLWTDLNNYNGFLDPWREFERMNRGLSRLSGRTSHDFPPLNVWTDADSAIVTSEIPGIDAGDIEISVTGKTLSLRGSRKADELGKDESYHRRERWAGQFSKTIELPFHVQTEQVKATFSKGILRITLPRAEAEKPKKIDIKSE